MLRVCRDLDILINLQWSCAVLRLSPQSEFELKESNTQCNCGKVVCFYLIHTFDWTKLNQTAESGGVFPSLPGSFSTQGSQQKSHRQAWHMGCILTSTVRAMFYCDIRFVLYHLVFRKTVLLRFRCLTNITMIIWLYCYPFKQGKFIIACIFESRLLFGKQDSMINVYRRNFNTLSFATHIICVSNECYE